MIVLMLTTHLLMAVPRNSGLACLGAEFGLAILWATCVADSQISGPSATVGKQPTSSGALVRGPLRQRMKEIS